MPHDPSVNIDYSGRMDVWLLDNSRELSRYVLWDRAPQRIKKLTTFQFRQNSEQSTIVENFHCPSLGFSTFEFACSKETPDCQIDFWWVKKTPLNGKYIAIDPCQIYDTDGVTFTGVWMKQFDSYGENH